MSRPELHALAVEKFKSFEAATRLELAPLTVILGRNNSGKSSLIQSLLLLRQTLADPRPEIMIRLEGVVEAFSLRELTFGWPKAADIVPGPSFTLEWSSDVDVGKAKVQARTPDMFEVSKNSKVHWIGSLDGVQRLRTKMKLSLREAGGETQVAEVSLWSEPYSDGVVKWDAQPLLRIAFNDGRWECYWRGELASELGIEFRHFIPILLIDRRNIGPRHAQRAWHTAYLMLFAQPLADLDSLLTGLHFLGSSRVPPPPIYKVATTAPNEIGVSGEFAAQLLHKRQRDLVHFLPPLQIANDGRIQVSSTVRAKSMVEAVNEVMRELSIGAPVKIQDVQELGFRLMFGEASLIHVGRGINSLLPLVELGLVADPLQFSGAEVDVELSAYNQVCPTRTYLALEEPEAHLHPKVASRLAHWFVSLAMSNRSLLVETHSDHLVRRLRGLAARAGAGSELERWLLNNVAIVAVEQTDGKSTITTSRLTSEGGVASSWPADFMDEATDEESAIYYAKLDKDSPPTNATAVELVEGDEPELDSEP